MREFVAEQHVAGSDANAAQRGADAARLAAEQLTREGTPVQFVRSIFIPRDETCVYVYEASRATQQQRRPGHERRFSAGSFRTCHGLPRRTTQSGAALLEAGQQAILERRTICRQARGPSSPIQW
jgi:hypothetical protein